jgi:hypothetical protein
VSFFTALLDAAGSYGQGRQQRLQNQQYQQTLDQNQQYRQAEEARQDSQLAIQQAAEARAADAAQRNKGIDPATGKPFLLPPALSQVAPGNKGKAATDAQTLAHLYAYANWLTQNGQTDLAASTLDRAKAMEADIRASNALTMRQNLDLYNQGQESQRTADEISAGITRTGMNNDTSLRTNANTVSGADERNIRTTDTSTQNNIRTTATSLANTQQHIVAETQRTAATEMGKYANANAISTRAGKPLPYPNLDAFNKNLGTNIATVAKDPSKLNSIIQGLYAHAADYNPAWIKAAVDALTNAAEQGAKAQQQTAVPVPTGGPSNLQAPALPQQ